MFSVHIFLAMLTCSNGLVKNLRTYKNILNEVNITERVKHIPNVNTRNIS